MDRKSMQNLQIDRRLIRRRGWISKQELERALEALPDVSSKSVPIAGPPEDAATGRGEPPRS